MSQEIGNKYKIKLITDIKYKIWKKNVKLQTILTEMRNITTYNKYKNKYKTVNRDKMCNSVRIKIGWNV